MGTVLVVIGIVFLVAGLAITLYQVFKPKPTETEAGVTIDKAILEAVKDLLEAFAKLTLGIQVCLIGLVLVYLGLTLS